RNRVLRFLIVSSPCRPLPRRRERRRADYTTEDGPRLESDAKLVLKDVATCAQEPQRRLGGVAGGEVHEPEAVAERGQRGQEMRGRLLVSGRELRRARDALAVLVEQGPGDLAVALEGHALDLDAALAQVRDRLVSPLPGLGLDAVGDDPGV